MKNKVKIANIFIDNLSFDDALNNILKLISRNNKSYVITSNVDHIVNLQEDSYFQHIYKNAGLIVPDGMPLIWASKILKNTLKSRVTGSDLLPALCQKSVKHGYKIFLLGGRPKAAKIAEKKLVKRFPNLKICGSYCPPFGFEKNNYNNKIIKIICDAKPDILFVGLGSPKQEKWIYNNKDILNVPVSIGVGASIDFNAGIIKRAPLFLQKAGFEWFWRLLMEPKKLWKRYLVKDLAFF